jgi:hypothetical protein
MKYVLCNILSFIVGALISQGICDTYSIKEIGLHLWILFFATSVFSLFFGKVIECSHEDLF